MQVSKLLEDVIEGRVEAIRAYIDLNAYYKAIKVVLSEIKTHALEEAEKHPKTFQLHGKQLTVKNGKRTWNFKECQSWIEADKNRTEVQDSLKSAYEVKHKGLALVNLETGEETEIPKCTFAEDILEVREIRIT